MRLLKKSKGLVKRVFGKRKYVNLTSKADVEGIIRKNRRLRKQKKLKLGNYTT